MATPNYNINENIKKLLEEVAKKNGVTYNQVKDLYVARFRFIKEAMESADRENGEFPTIGWIKFCNFYVSNKKKVTLARINNRVKEKNDETI